MFTKSEDNPTETELRELLPPVNRVKKVQVETTREVDVGDETKMVTEKGTQCEINKGFIEDNYNL